MNIGTTQVEAYRQTNEQLPPKETAVKKDDLNPGETRDSEKIVLPGNDAHPAAIRVDRSPSLLSRILSPEESDLLVKYFARYGDEPESSQLYDPGARTRATSLTGLRVDLKG